MCKAFAPQALAVGEAGGMRQSPNNGDGTKMAFWIGAAPQRNYPWGVGYYIGQFYSIDTEAMRFVFAGPRYYNMMPSLAVNAKGERFMNEDVSVGMGVSPFFKQPGMLGYIIWTKNIAYALAPWEGFGRYYGMDANAESYSGDEIIELWETGLSENNGGGERTLENAKFDTLDELAEHFDIPVDTLKKTVATYNEKCLAGVDDEFGKRSGRLIGIEDDGPFYVSKTIPAVMEVFGGPRCDIDARVLDDNDTPIEGLYEVGSMMGDIYQNYYTFSLTGVNMGFFCLTYGYMTGKALAEGKI
jgi:hypothetical protein